MTMMFAYAIILNTVLRNDISATTFCLIMMAAPLLVMDKPWRLFCYFVLILAVFVPIDFQSKAYYLAYTDTVNVLCSLFLGTVIHMSIIRTKIREIMQRPDKAMCGRFGGDEFQIWIPEICDTKDLDVYLKKLLSDVRKIQTPDERMKISLSVGGAVSPDNGDDYFTLLENADAALYSAKSKGRDGYVFYQGEH